MEIPSLIVFAAIAAFTPGPNNIMIMTSGLNFGSRASLPHYFGICLGFPTMFFAMGFGLGYLFERYALLHEIIQVAGILYLLYLAWLIANSGPATVDGEQAKPLSFIQAALFQWINPKAWIMSTSAIAAYTTVGADINTQIVLIGLIFAAMAFPSAGVWMVFGTGLQRLINKPIHLRTFNVIMALLLVGSIAPIVMGLLRKVL